MFLKNAYHFLLGLLFLALGESPLIGDYSFTAELTIVF
jgi:hypothetical protein